MDSAQLPETELSSEFLQTTLGEHSGNFQKSSFFITFEPFDRILQVIYTDRFSKAKKRKRNPHIFQNFILGEQRSNFCQNPPIE
jgi:hypothetical protein